jgi:predicted outer membrane repeat protein
MTRGDSRIRSGAVAWGVAGAVGAAVLAGPGGCADDRHHRTDNDDHGPADDRGRHGHHAVRVRRQQRRDVDRGVHYRLDPDLRLPTASATRSSTSPPASPSPARAPTTEASRSSSTGTATGYRRRQPGVHHVGATTVNNLTVTGGSDGGGRGGALRAGGRLVVNGSTFSGNTATNGGGAVDVESGNVTITNSTFSGNTASGSTGGALHVHGSVTAVTTITGSTFNGNHDANNDGGAIYSDGIVTVVNSTLTGDSVTGASGAAVSAEQITLAYADVTNNTASTPSNGQLLMRRSNPRTPGVFDPFASVIGTFPSGTAGCSYSGGTPPNATSNLRVQLPGRHQLPAGTVARPVPAATDVVTTTDPLLGALANNGGPTATLLPGAGCPLLDKIPASARQTAPLATGVTTDQRGVPRPDAGSPSCDVGAVEVQPAPTTLIVAFTG